MNGGRSYHVILNNEIFLVFKWKMKRLCEPCISAWSISIFFKENLL